MRLKATRLFDLISLVTEIDDIINRGPGVEYVILDKLHTEMNAMKLDIQHRKSEVVSLDSM